MLLLAPHQLGGRVLLSFPLEEVEGEGGELQGRQSGVTAVSWGATAPPARGLGGSRPLLTCSTLVMATSASICRALRSRVRS